MKEETVIALLKWFKKTRRHPQVLRDVVIDTQWYVFLMLIIFAGLFVATAIIGKPAFSMWFMALLSIQLLFKTAMNYAEID